MKGPLTKPLFPVCRKCSVTPLMHLGWIWECPRCGLRITTAAVRHDSGAARSSTH
jgi:ribosomal protein L37AE/L43A